MFEEEAAKPENSKVEGQTVRAGMEGIMKDNGMVKRIMLDLIMLTYIML